MADNTLTKLKDALNQLSSLLDNAAIKTALGAIPASLKTPIIEGLKKVLDVVKTTLNELKQKINSVIQLDQLFATTTSLLDAVAGLAPDQQSTLDSVRSVVSTLQDVSQAQQEIDAILAQIDGIVTKLGAV
jgi:uncharacterized protein YoxC